MSSAAVEPVHLVHGMGTAPVAPTWPAITAAEAKAVLAHFPTAGRLMALRWHSPRPFSAATLLQTSQGELFLKRHHQSVRSPAALAEEHAFMAHLRSAGLCVPGVLALADGTGALATGDWTYELHRQAPGIDLYRDRTSWTPFLSHHHAYQAGAALARLHLASQGFPAAPRGPHPLVASFSILPASNPLAAAEAYVVARPALGKFLASKPWRQELARLFGVFGGGLSDRLSGECSLWTHNDWHPSNLLWSTDGAVRTIFDFGLATRTCALHDLATAIERTAIPWLELGEGADGKPADADAALAILAGYRTVRPLDTTDVDTITRLLPLVHIEFALSEVDYFTGILADDAQATLAWKTYLIGHAEWYLSPSGKDFLQAFARGVMA